MKKTTDRKQWKQQINSSVTSVQIVLLTLEDCAG